MRITPILCAALLAAAAPGCDVADPRPLAARRCDTVTATAPLDLAVSAAADGIVRFSVEPRGLAVTASLAAGPGSPARAASPVDRLGLVTLLAPVREGEPLALRVASRDSRDLDGEVCVEGVLLNRGDARRLAAERAFADAGAATLARRWERAFEQYSQAARRFRERGLRALAGAAAHAAGELAYLRLHREQEALALARRARNDYGAEADPAVRGALLALEARAAAEVRDLAAPPERAAVQQLIDSSRAALATSAAGRRETLRLGVLEGYLAYRADDPERAHRSFTAAMRACRDARDWECHAQAAQNVALLDEARQSTTEALRVYAEALRHLDTAASPGLAADILDNMGRLQRVAGLVSESDASHAAALRLYAVTGDCDGTRRTLARLGALRAQVGSLEDALEELRRAAGDGCAELLARAAGGVSRSADEAAPLCETALPPEELSTDGRLAVFQALLSSKDAALLSGRTADAGRCVQLAASYAGSSRAQVRTANARGEVVLERGDARGARRAFMEAREIADAAALAPTYEHRGRADLGLARASLLAADLQEAQAHAVRALTAASARADVTQAVEALQILASGLRGAGETARAATTLAVAIELVESVPIDALDGDVRATFLAVQHAAFGELTGLLAGTARDAPAVWRAFEVAERGRARALRYAIQQERRGAPPARGAADDHRALLGRLASALEATGELEPRAIADRLVPLATAESKPGDVAPGRRELMGQLAREGATLVQYAAGGGELFAFVIDADGLRLVRLGAREDITQSATRLAEALRRREADGSAIRAAARELARQAWWPVAPFVRRGRVYIAPEDALHLVPFAVLPWSQDGTELIVQRAESTLVPSALFLAESRARRGASARGIALIGDPVFRSAPWQAQCASEEERAATRSAAARETPWTEWLPSLPASRDEVLAIARLAREAREGARATVLLGCDATSEALRRAASGNYGLLHIATHGRIDARRPRLSALVLAPDDGARADATFALREILELRLTARLVTLSACDTSSGRLLRGEGVLGLAQAFLQAGAQTVIASSWRIEDEATAQFMRELYRRLLDQNMSSAAALRSVQLRQLTQSGSYAWAAFAVYGRPDTRI